MYDYVSVTYSLVPLKLLKKIQPETFLVNFEKMKAKKLCTLFLLVGLYTTFTNPEKIIFGESSEPKGSKIFADHSSKRNENGGSLSFPTAVDKTVFDRNPPVLPRSESASSVGLEDSRQGRVFSFPSGSKSTVARYPGAAIRYENPATHFTDIIQYEEVPELPQHEAPSALQNIGRLFNLLPTSNGMQVGLDFRLPFFSLPFSKLFSGLAEGNSASLASGLFDIGSGTSTLATIAALVVGAALLYPKIFQAFGSTAGKSNLRANDDFVTNLNTILEQFNIDGESCLRVALCTFGSGHRTLKGRTDSNTTPIDVVDTILNLESVKKSLARGSLRQARDYGDNGGDCDAYNRDNKCPVKAETWKMLLYNLSKAS